MQKKTGLTAAQIAVLMGILTLGSKLVGLVRTILMANYYGTGMVTDAFSLSQDIPVMLFGALFSAVATAYMPIYSRKYELKGEQAANRFTSQVLNLLLLISVLSSVVGILFSDPIARFFGHREGGFSEEGIRLLAYYLKVSFSFLLFNSAATLLEAFLQYKNAFLSQIFVGYGQTACIIALTVVSAHTSYYLLVYGVLLGCAFRALCMWFLARGKGFRYVGRAEDGGGSERRLSQEIMALSIPVFIGGSINQINVLVDKFLAAGLPEGTIGALNYGNIFITMISTLTVAILVTVIYPKLTQATLSGDHQRFSAMASQGMSVSMIIAAPFTLGAMVYCNPVVQVVFERGNFTTDSVAMTEPALFWYSAGITFVAANALLVKIYYALGDARTPVVCAAAAAAVNVGADLALVGPMAHGGLALATSLAAAVNALMLYALMRKKYPQVRLLPSAEKVWAILLFSALSVGASWLLYRFLAAHFWMPRTVLLALAVAPAGMIYWILLCHAEIEEIRLIRDLFAPLRKKRKR